MTRRIRISATAVDAAMATGQPIQLDGLNEGQTYAVELVDDRPLPVSWFEPSAPFTRRKPRKPRQFKRGTRP